MKTLYLNRHAKSSWKDLGQRDFDRPLNKRGLINAEFMAKKFAAEEKVDLLISSPAIRAISTARYFAKALDMGPSEILLDKNIYGSEIEQMLTIINSIDDTIDSAIIFGHNPTFSSLAAYLDNAFYDDLVTCARVKIEFQVDSWKEVSGDIGTIAHFIYPRYYDEMKDL